MYVVADSSYNHYFEEFYRNDLSLEVEYELYYANGLRVNPQMFTFSSYFRRVTLWTPLNTKVGKYYLEVRGTYTIPIDYYVKSGFMV